MKRLLILTAVFAAVLSACASAKTFTGSQLNGIVLGQNDTPTGLTFISQGSGPQTIDQVASDSTEQGQLQTYGFQSAYSSFYANTAALGVLSQQTQTASPSAKVVAAIAIVFKTADGAHKAITLEHQNDVKNGTNVTTVSSDKVGEETIAESGQQKDFPFPGFLLYFREGNAVFAVLVAGGPTAGASIVEATNYAKTMDARAKKA